MRTLLITLIIPALLFSCKSNDTIKSEIVDLQVDVARFSVAGNNLLSLATVNHYNLGDIKAYYLQNGVAVQKSFSIMTNDSNNESYLSVSVDQGTEDQEITSTLLQWKSNDVDTLKTQISRKSGELFISKLWLNGDLEYEAGVSTGTNWGGTSFERLVMVRR